MSEIVKLIADSFLFNKIDFSEIDLKFSITENVQCAEYAAGELILSADKHINALCIIDFGKVRITSDSGDKDTVLRYAERGEIFGAATIFSKTTHRTKVFAVTETKVVFLEKELICQLIKSSSTIAMNYINFLSDKIAFLNKKVSAFTAGIAEVRLALYLLGNVDENNHVICKSSMSDVADQLGIGRASLYRAITSLTNSGFIEHNGKSFTLLERDSLVNMVN